MIKIQRMTLALLALLSSGESIVAAESQEPGVENPLVIRAGHTWSQRSFYIEVLGAEKATCEIFVAEGNDILTKNEVIILDNRYLALDFVPKPLSEENPYHVCLVPKDTAVVFPRKLNENGKLVEEPYVNLYNTTITLDAGFDVWGNKIEIPKGFTIVGALSRVFKFYIKPDQSDDLTRVYIRAQIEGKSLGDLEISYYQFLAGDIIINSHGDQTTVSIEDRSQSWRSKS